MSALQQCFSAASAASLLFADLTQPALPTATRIFREVDLGDSLAPRCGDALFQIGANSMPYGKGKFFILNVWGLNCGHFPKAHKG